MLNKLSGKSLAVRVGIVAGMAVGVVLNYVTEWSVYAAVTTVVVGVVASWVMWPTEAE